MKESVIPLFIFFSLFLFSAFPRQSFAAVSTVSFTATNSPKNLPAAWNAVAWSSTLNLFAAVDQSGLIATSPDGVTWTTQATPQGFALFAITWSPDANIFVATGAGGHVMTSTTGSNWATQVTGGHLLQSVVWSPTAFYDSNAPGEFVAVSSNGSQATQVITSHDGLSWTTQNAAAAQQWASVTWSPALGLFVAVALDGTVANQVMFSSNGKDWSKLATQSSAANQWNSVAWSPELGVFVAVAKNNSGTMWSATGTGTWTAGTGAANNSWFSVAWSSANSKFVAVATTGTGTRVMYSSNGTSWSASGETYSTDNAWQTIAWSPGLGKFLAASNNSATLGAQMMTSTDGLTWTNQTAVGTTTSAWYSSTWAPGVGGTGLFVAVSLSGALMTSPDGATWTMRTIPAGVEPRSVAWSPEQNRFVVVVETTPEVLTSSDGITWAEQTSSGSIANDAWYSVVWSPTASDGINPAGLFVAVANSNAGVMTSHDGITWTMRTTGVANSGWKSVVWSPEQGIFLAVAASGTTSTDVMTSPDGVTWTNQTINTANQWFKVTWAPSAPNDLGGTGEFVAVSFNGTQAHQVMTSPTGLSGSWTDHSSASVLQWEAVSWSPELGVFVAVALNGTASTGMMISPDGATWTSLPVATTNLWSGITYSPDLGVFVALGNSGYAVNTSTVAAPAISAISSGTPGSSTATITWTTDEKASSRVFYSTDLSYGSSTTLDASLVFSHSVGLSGLTCGTAYHYKVSSTLFGQNTLSGDNTFITTLGACVPPTVTAQTASSLTQTSATLNGAITATGGANATIRGFNYGLSAGYGSTINTSGSYSTGAYAANLTGLLCGNTYHYQAYATNSAGTGTSTPDATFATSACASSSGSGGSHGTTIGFSDVWPTGISGAPLDFSINGGARSAGTPTLAIMLNGDPKTVSGYAISLDPQFIGGGIMPYAASTAFTLPDVAGIYTLYVEYFSTTGRVSPVIAHSIAYQKGRAASASGLFMRTLAAGVSDSEVFTLQKFLNARGFTLVLAGPGSPGSETEFYGRATKNAVIKFQEAHKAEILAPLGLSQGTGTFGRATMTFANTLLAGGQ